MTLLLTFARNHRQISHSYLIFFSVLEYRVILRWKCNSIERFNTTSPFCDFILSLLHARDWLISWRSVFSVPFIASVSRLTLLISSFTFASSGQCYLRGVIYDHGEKVSPKQCVECSCADGSFTCQRFDTNTKCPPLKCAPNEQISVAEECCKFCPGRFLARKKKTMQK